MTIAAILNQAAELLAKAGIDSPHLDAQILLATACARDRLWTLTHPEQKLQNEEYEKVLTYVARRVRREPLPYLTESREFMGLLFRVTPAVMIPRSETEVLVEAVLDRAHTRESAMIADIGTGCGAIAVSCAHFLPHARVVATDISEAALALAQDNARGFGVADRVMFVRGHLLEPFLTSKWQSGVPRVFDFIAANLPYVPKDEIENLQPEVNLFEPRVALDGGRDGLDCYRELIPQAARVMQPHGYVLCEVGLGQAQCLADILQESGFIVETVLKDLAQIDRVVVARRKK